MPAKITKRSLLDPSQLPAFDRAMRGLVKVPKAELEAELQKDQTRKSGKMSAKKR